MNRRGFFKALIATAVVATASSTRLGKLTRDLTGDLDAIGQQYAEALARSLIETKEILVANILNGAFSSLPEHNALEKLLS